MFFTVTFCAEAAPVVKITGLEFDNSDNIVIINSIGKIFPKTQQTPEDNDKSIRTPENVITKCFLGNPDKFRYIGTLFIHLTPKHYETSTTGTALRT